MTGLGVTFKIEEVALSQAAQLVREQSWGENPRP